MLESGCVSLKNEVMVLMEMWMVIVVEVMMVVMMLKKETVMVMMMQVNIMMKNVVDVVLGGVSYWAIGYGLSYGSDTVREQDCAPALEFLLVILVC